MDRHKDHNKARDKDIHEKKDHAIKKDFDATDEALEEKMRDEKASEEQRQDERRKASRRDCDRNTEEEKECILKENRKLQSEMENLKDTMQRRQADFENYKKRIAKQQVDYRKTAIRDFAGDIMQINDDLLRAIEASENIQPGASSEESHRSFVQGVSMISRRIEETMNKYGVVEIEALNQEFDPNFHEAVEIDFSDGVGFDTVTKVYQKGFRIDDLVVRSARVRVTKPKKSTAAETDESERESGASEEGTVH